jgi:hypothetical protein
MSYAISKLFILPLAFLIVISIDCNKVLEHQQNKICGKRPQVVHYIYGGRQSMIERWPWQVNNSEISTS